MNFKSVITFIILLFSQLIQAEISIRVDRTPVIADESFQLIFESNQKVDGDPDFSLLNKSFTVLNTGRRSNTQIINGKLKQSQQWILTVITNKTGILSIPAIQFGKEFSKVAKIKVVKNASSNSNSADDIFIEVNVNTKSPYVQAQIIYSVKLYRAVQTNNASLSEPVISGGQAVINKLGEDKSFETRLNGKKYVVIQRQFVIFPQSSGALKIEPLLFQGQTGSGSIFGFDPFGPQPKSIVKRSATIHLDVKSIPDSFTGDTWLPASLVNVQEQWSIDPAKLKQGEAATRTLILKAEGLVASNLPETKSEFPTELKIYPDQPEFKETINEKGITGIRHDKMAVIPTAAGDYVLPEIKIPWWNTDTDKMEFAELPERTIHANVSVTAPVINIPQTPVENEVPLVEKEIDEKNSELIESSNIQTPWKWVSLTLFILWLMTLYVFWKNKHELTSPNNQSDTELSSRQYLKQLKQACANNDPVMAKQALLDWAKVTWPDKKVNSIDALKAFCAEELRLKLDELNSCLYGKESNQWDGADFLNSFQSQSFKDKKTGQTKGNLEPLYKT